VKRLVRTGLVSIIESCSVGCRFCFRADKSAAVMSPELFSRTLSRLHEVGVEAITITGGEPLEHPYLCDLLQVSEAFPISISLITSASIPQSRFLIGKVAHLLDGVTVSADSAGAARLGGVDRRVSNALDCLRTIPMTESALHIAMFQLTEAEVIQWTQYSRESPAIAMEFSPLQLDPRLYIVSGLTLDRYLAIRKSDIELISRYFAMPESFWQKQEQLNDRTLVANNHAICQSRRVFVNAVGELRRCPYDKKTSTSVLAPRSEIQSFFESWQGNVGQLDTRCVGICH
jgi:molybdenum cofactor biosynthesis enzyme MoaA